MSFQCANSLVVLRIRTLESTLQFAHLFLAGQSDFN